MIELSINQSITRLSDYPITQFTISLSASDKIDDFHLIALVNLRGLECSALQDDQVVLDGDASRIDLQLGQQRRYSPWTVDLVGVAVQHDFQGRTSRSARTKLPTGK